MNRHPPTSALSPVLDEMLRLHGRLQPHLLRYRQLMSDDQDYTNRVCTLHHCSGKLHFFMFYWTVHILYYSSRHTDYFITEIQINCFCICIDFHFSRMESIGVRYDFEVDVEPVFTVAVCMCSSLKGRVPSACAIWHLKFCTHWVMCIIMSAIWWWTWAGHHLATFALLLQCQPLPSYSRQFLFRYMIYIVYLMSFV